MQTKSVKTSVLSLVALITVFAPQTHAQTPPTPQIPPVAAPASTPTPTPTPAPSPLAELTQLLTNSVQTGTTLQIGTVTVDLALVRNLYSLRGYRPAFVSHLGATPIVATLRTILNEAAEDHGLKASYYWSSEIEMRLGKKDAASLMELDLLLTQAYIQFASDVNTGRVNPQIAAQNLADIELKKRAFKDFDALNKMTLDQNSLLQGMWKLEPQTAAYQRLIAVLTHLHDVKEKGGWPALTPTKVIKPGESDANIPAIRMRLVDMGLITDLSQRTNASLVYDPAVVQGIVYLQASLKLGVDAVIGRDSFTALSGSIDDRITQIRANLERWRLMPRDLGQNYALVDLGRQDLDIIKDGKHALHMRVVVGQELRQTPTFIDQITDVIVNPYWNAPTSIVVKDILPKAIADRDYFYKLNMRVFKNGSEIDPASVNWSQYSASNPPPYSFREEPGDENSLGRLKFNLSENHHAIYMHDTNHHELFAREQRLYSSGCIRLEQPLVLADFLLREQGLDSNEILGMINDPSVVAKRIKLKEPMRVYIMGTTVAVDPNGIVRFGLDIYKQDKRILDAMNAAR